MKFMEFFARGLTPSSHNQKAHQLLIEHPGKARQQLLNHVANEDLSYSMGSKFAGTPSKTLNKKFGNWRNRNPHTQGTK